MLAAVRAHDAATEPGVAHTAQRASTSATDRNGLVRKLTGGGAAPLDPWGSRLTPLADDRTCAGIS